MRATEIRVDKSNFSRREIAGRDLTPADGQVLVKVDRFALTSNNVTYAAIGEQMGYWRFYPAPEPWGIIPVWGFGTILQSRAHGLAEGQRFYGYWPSASHALLTPGRVGASGFVDTASHRHGLAPIYNSYLVAQPGADEARISLFRPLYGTAYLLDRMLAGSSEPGTVLLTSASSKTALGLAHALNARGAPPIGLTSAANRNFVEQTGWFASVLAYDELDKLDAEARSTLVDFSGDAPLKAALHDRLHGLAASHVVGITHWNAAPSTAKLAGPEPRMFFAPTEWEAQAKAMGAQAFEAAMQQSFARFVADAHWLRISEENGPAAYGRRLDALLNGHARPEEGYVLTL